METKEDDTPSIQNSYQRNLYKVIQDVLGILQQAPGVSTMPCTRVQAGGHQEAEVAIVFLGDQTLGQVNTADSRKRMLSG